MRPSRTHCPCALLALVAYLSVPARTKAEDLTITSSPAGATVEISGLTAGTTPYKTTFPSGYFHKPHTVFGARLDHSMVLRVTKEGYLSQQITLTEGPFEWVSINGRHHGNYFLLKSGRFDVKLDPIAYGRNAVETIGHDGPMRPPSAEVLREVVRDTGTPISSVTVASDPPGAEIYIDGEFVGQTPSILHLSSGSHRVALKSPGKQDWTRDLEVLKDSQLTLHPVLRASP